MSVPLEIRTLPAWASRLTDGEVLGCIAIELGSAWQRHGWEIEDSRALQRLSYELAVRFCEMHNGSDDYWNERADGTRHFTDEMDTFMAEVLTGIAEEPNWIDQYTFHHVSISDLLGPVKPVCPAEEPTTSRRSQAQLRREGRVNMPEVTEYTMDLGGGERIKVWKTSEGATAIHSTVERADVGEYTAGAEQFNAAVDGIESLLLALGAAGVDVSLTPFHAAARAALEAAHDARRAARRKRRRKGTRWPNRLA